MMNIVLAAVVVMGLLGLFFALVLAFASKKLAIKEDPRLEKILKVLPGVNCGVCGYAGCREYAKAIMEKGDPYDLCKVGKERVAGKIKEIMEESLK